MAINIVFIESLKNYPTLHGYIFINVKLNDHLALAGLFIAV